MSSLENKIKQTLQFMKEQYLADSRPWVVTYSGGKDSTTVLNLVITLLQELHIDGKDTKHTYIVSSDTNVEMPIIEKYIQTKLDEITYYANNSQLSLSCHKLSPKTEESFWPLLLGKGYPSPTSSFRWCTERMKINPATHFLKNLIGQHQSILMLLGVRSAESQSRQKSIDGRELNARGLSRHDTIPNAFVLSPIKDWSNEEVWSYLIQHPFPWGDHSYMMSLYDKGSGEGDCNIALNPEAPSCGKTRFGCWVCTVVEKDRSMEGMLKNGEEWMTPLWHLREKLYVYRSNPEKRDDRKRDGSKGFGPFLPAVRRELLNDLLETEKELTKQYNKVKNNTNNYTSVENFILIRDDEIELIQQFWNSDGDISNSAFRIAQKHNRLLYKSTDTKLGSKLEQFRNEINIDLFERIYEVEMYRKNIGTRYGILNEIEKRAIDFFKGEYREAN